MNIPKVIQLSSGTYYCQVRVGGKSVSFSDDNRDVVLAKAVAYKAGLLDVQKHPTHMTLSAAIDRYIEERENILSPSTIRGYRGIQRNRFQAFISRPVDFFDRRTCRKMINLEAPLCSAKTLVNAWHFVSAVLFDVTGERINVQLPQIIRNDRPFLAPEQIPIFIDAVLETNVAIPALLALNSLRRSEILGLDWKNIDLEKRMLTVSGSIVFDEDNNLIEKRTNKNASSQRTIPILIPQLVDLLAAVEDKTGKVIREPHPNNLYLVINKICEKNGLPLVGVHGLRHSFASLSYHLGISEQIAMQIGGWADSQTMRKIYTHISQSDMQKSASSISAFFENPSAIHQQS